MLFSGTIAENITIGNKESTLEDVIKVSKKTKCYDFIQRLPKKFFTYVGEHGASLSGGERQRISLARVLIKNPDVLILDEPTVGLDPEQVIEIRELIKSLRKDHTVILSSHILSEIDAVCSKIVIIDNGKIVASDKTENLSMSKSKAHRYIARIKGSKDDIVAAFRGVEGISKVNPRQCDEPGVLDFGIEASRDVREDVFFAMAKINAPILGLRPRETSLEETFIKITSDKKEEK